MFRNPIHPPQKCVKGFSRAAAPPLAPRRALCSQSHLQDVFLHIPAAALTSCTDTGTSANQDLKRQQHLVISCSLIKSLNKGQKLNSLTNVKTRRESFRSMK